MIGEDKDSAFTIDLSASFVSPRHGLLLLAREGLSSGAWRSKLPSLEPPASPNGRQNQTGRNRLSLQRQADAAQGGYAAHYRQGPFHRRIFAARRGLCGDGAPQLCSTH